MRSVFLFSFSILWMTAMLCISCRASATEAPDGPAGTEDLPSAARAVEPSIVLSPRMPERLSFAGEEVPLQMFDVFESLEKELIVNAYLHSSTMQCIKRAARFFPAIEPILKANGIPDDFKYLCVIESSLTQAVSPAGAAGFWQFLKTTAAEFGLEVNTEVDERYNIDLSTAAACRYLQSARDQFGSWTMAAAAYNMGKAGAARQVRRQRISNYYDLLLNDETARYVYRILALKVIMEQPGTYGFTLQPNELYAPIPCDTVKVSTPVPDLVKFAFDHGINYKTLKIMNPWLRETTLSNKRGKTYRILIPEAGFRPSVSEMLDEASIRKIESTQP